MNKSIIITITLVWLLCTIYFTLARNYGYPYMQAALVGSWAASIVLLISILIYVGKNRQK